MEEERGSTEVVAKTNEPLITVPNPKAYQSNAVAQVSVASVPGQSKYVQLLGVIEELGRDIRPSYAGSKSSAERIKRGIVHARILTMFTTLDTFDTEYSADSVEWCPTENFRDLFVCGTYQLVPDDSASSPGVSSSGQTRLGRIYLHRVMPSGKLHLVQSLNTPAILDMKWARVERPRDFPLLGVVDSIGCLQIYRLTRGDEGEPRLELATHRRICDASETDVLALSLDWDTRRNADSVDEFRLVVSDSRGGVSMYSFVPNSELVEVCAAKKLHDFEAWITAFDYWCPNIVYSGGDDCKFHRLDSRMGLKSTACIRKHEAGVTSMHSNAAREYILATGSYDEMLRLWDTRNFRAPISETNLHGGVWRLKWDPHNHTKLFAACMYGGFRVIDCSAESSPQIFAEYNEHGSIAYGCDWSYLDNLSVSSKILGEDPKNVALAATCSFYDHTLKISRLDIESN